MNETLTIALSKGRIFKETVPLLKQAGIEPVDDPETSRKLILDTNLAHVKLVIAERELALTAPRNALKRRDGRQFVVVERAGEWVETGVRTGWRSASAVEILSGVSQGDIVELNPR